MSGSDSSRYLYRIAMLCGILPMTVGVSIYILYEITRWDVLVLAGLFTVYGGLACAALGFICIIAYAFKRHAAGEMWGLGVGKAVGVILLNIPVCVIVVHLSLLSVTRMDSYTVVLENKGEDVVAHFELETPGGAVGIEGIAPGESESVRLSFEDPGSITYRAEVGNDLLEGVIENHVANSGGGKKSIITFSDGEFSIERME